MNKTKFIQKIKNVLSSSAFRAMSLCVCISFVLWLFIAFSDYRQHDFNIPIQFEDSTKPNEIFFTRDSFVVVNVEATGFKFLFNSGFETKKEKIHFDINKLPINKAKTEMKISSEFLKGPILKSLGMEDVAISVMPDTIFLKWQKKFSKRIPVVNKTKFETRASYKMVKNPDLLVNEVIVEGEKRLLEKLDTLYTKNILVSNIDKSHISLIPIEIPNAYRTLDFQTTNVPIEISVEEITENVIELPVSIVQQGEEQNIKIFPSKVSVKYRIPIKDFKKCNPKDFNVYVQCSKEDLQKFNKLKVKYANIPANVEIVNISPKTVEYLIINE